MYNPLPAIRRWATARPKVMWLLNGLVTALLQNSLIWAFTHLFTMPLFWARAIAYVSCGQVNFVLNHNTTWSSRHHPDITKLSTVYKRFLILNWSVAFVNAGLQAVFAWTFGLLASLLGASTPDTWILAFGLSYANVGLANAITAGINWFGYDKFVFRHVVFDESDQDKPEADTPE